MMVCLLMLYQSRVYPEAVYSHFTAAAVHSGSPTRLFVTARYCSLHLFVSPIPRLTKAPSGAELFDAIAARSGRTRGHRA